MAIFNTNPIYFLLLSSSPTVFAVNVVDINKQLTYLPNVRKWIADQRRGRIERRQCEEDLESLEKLHEKKILVYLSKIAVFIELTTL